MRNRLELISFLCFYVLGPLVIAIFSPVWLILAAVAAYAFVWRRLGESFAGDDGYGDDLYGVAVFPALIALLVLIVVSGTRLVIFLLT